MKCHQAITTIFSLACLAGCVAVPEYKQTATEATGAYLIPKVETSTLVSGAATVSLFDDPAVCGEPFPNLRHVFKISKGNPLISNLNADGAWVPANVKTNLSVMVLLDGGFCGMAFSFTPKQGQRYQLNIHGVRGKMLPFQPPSCEVSVAMIDSAGRKTGYPSDFQTTVCTPKSGNK